MSITDVGDTMAPRLCERAREREGLVSGAQILAWVRQARRGGGWGAPIGVAMPAGAGRRGSRTEAGGTSSSARLMVNRSRCSANFGAPREKRGRLIMRVATSYGVVATDGVVVSSGVDSPCGLAADGVAASDVAGAWGPSLGAQLESICDRTS